MDEKDPRPSPPIIRAPLTDATRRINNGATIRSEPEERTTEEVRAEILSDPMSIVTSPLSTKGHVEINCMSPEAKSQVNSNRNSTLSAHSLLSNKGKRKTHVGPWQLGRTLGRGSTGRVRLAKHALTGQTAAIKIVSKKSAAIAQSESIAAMDKNIGHYSGGTARPMPSGIEREVVIMKLIEHPNVISLYDVWENRGELYLVLEYVEGGELFDYVSNHGPLPEEEAVRIFRQIIAGLGHCHRFHICHRDLKPENILLDAWHNVKLADFGMAALQPAGHWLNTSCGSPHYAAPEIIYGRRYRGDKADIWSCGIILYALLTGYLPFDGGDLPTTLRLVKKAEFMIPRELSYEATDLIERILRKKPEDRVNMEQIFMHPLLKKYEKFHQARSNHYLGPAPPIYVHDCGPPVLARQDIDLDLLRNLQTLWHDVKPDALIQRLLENEPTQERMFYNALVKFRNEQLENYQGQPLEYSASDYHHISRGPARIGNKRTGSRKRNQVPTRDKTNSPAREPKSCATVESYDPFRSPKNRISDKEPQFARVTIHRRIPEEIHKEHSAEVVQVPNSVPDSDPGYEDCPPSSPFAVVRNKKSKVNSMKSFQSKASYSSSRRPLNATPTPRSASYKRNVCFRHGRYRSQGSMSAKASNTQVNVPTMKKDGSDSSFEYEDDGDPFSDRFGSPVLPAQPTVVRGSGITVKNCSQMRKVRESDFIWKDEARKVSHELGQICEEAFNGSSVSTGCTTSTCTDPETPATSVSMASPEDSYRQISTAKSKRRSGSSTPGASPRSYTVAELAETRRRLIQHSTHDGAEDVPAYLTAVISHLDRLIEQDKLRQSPKRTGSGQNPRVSQADQLPKPPRESSFLPIISEEANAHTGHPANTNEIQQDLPVSLRSGPGSRPTSIVNAGRRTIRMVPQSSTPSMDNSNPLDVRKRHRNRETNLADSQPLVEDYEALPEIESTTGTRYASASSRASRNPCELAPIAEIPPKSPRRSARGPEPKKWSWFRNRSHTSTETAKMQNEDKPLQSNAAAVVIQEVNEPAQPSPTEVSTPPKTQPQSPPKQKRGFLSKLMKRKPSNTPETQPTDDPAENNPLLRQLSSNETPLDTESAQKPLPRKPRAPRSQNWFARVFHFKPATRVIALNTSKIKGRKEVYKILREWEWKQYGLEEVSMDKSNNIILGRVGEVNLLRLRPVKFSAEFYTILEHGQQANLSLVRFRQERGAASSFQKVVDTLHLVMKQRGILVEDAFRAKKMTRILDAFPDS
ncbi:putative serine/threonine protein kinase [Aspergillus steynii IBT 23096]|uniref:non-specific serine/threonine protein kinase n=1 Tax=Aspergillus steynii IBT 23096 TaxID=1392250 RepID=A0A2I2G8K0_9EURO|nr:putative serine/threonine protein kinase [Aspergillus steynii IBT 23096]PLB49204.1 putative serine/threonine protein kinase [Aspergillus steynii IBT 23096]